MPQRRDAEMMGGTAEPLSALHAVISHGARSKFAQDILSDLLDMRLTRREHPCPIRRGCSKHHAIVGINPHRRRASTGKIRRILGPLRTYFGDAKNNEA